ncbi:shikimate dehydrogenase [Microbacterium sp.]|uniref:shikimate dehydrogenase n=1 Tax=Microbacterium sp. TaxID=51671 RepID=UPI00260C6425|nr:shikimate dehydrogenase [Microbacterium sp.]
MTARLAVWGAPIDHSKSPALHTAAYRALGLDWEYGRKHVDAEHFAAELAQGDATWRGLSLTMPLKEVAFRSATRHDRHAELTGAVNTLLFADALHGFNTDVGGIIDALAENGIRSLASARILGAGATAASALVAASEMGAQHVDLRARRPERAGEIARLGERLGVSVAVSDFLSPASDVDATIATLPTGTVLDADVTRPLAATGGVLLDAAYAPWPSALASVWNSAGAISGLAMLFNQAVRQVRVFVHGDPLIELPDEARVRDEMYTALMGD